MPEIAAIWRALAFNNVYSSQRFAEIIITSRRIALKPCNGFGAHFITNFLSVPIIHIHSVHQCSLWRSVFVQAQYTATFFFLFPHILTWIDFSFVFSVFIRLITLQFNDLFIRHTTVVVETLRYRLEGRGFDSRLCPSGCAMVLGPIEP